MEATQARVQDMTPARSLRVATVVSVLLLGAALTYLCYVFAIRHAVSPGDFGSLLGGLFSPLVFFWVVYTAYLQYRVLQNTTIDSEHTKAAQRSARLLEVVRGCTEASGLRAIRVILDRVHGNIVQNWPTNINKLHDDPDVHASAIQHLDALELASIAVLRGSVDEEEARALLERHLVVAFSTIQYALKDWRAGPMKGVASYHNLQILANRWIILNTGHGDLPPLEPVLSRPQRLSTPDPLAYPTPQ
jgi:hypothetical protein